MDPFTGAVNSFLPLNAATVGQDITDANGLVLMPSSAPSGADLYVSRGGIGAASKILKVVDASPTSSGAGDTQDSFSEVFADLPIGDIVSSDGYSTIWAANVQTDLTKQITVRDLYLYDGSSPSPDINLPANVTGGGFTGLTWLPSDYQFLGAYGNKMVQFDTTGLVVANFTVEDVGSIQGVLLWPGQEPTLLVADGSDGAIKKVVIATTLDAELAYSLPTAPGAPSGSAVKGLETDSWTGNLVVLVRGTPTDVLLFLDPTDGTLLDSLKLDVAHVGEDISDSEGVGVQSGDVFVIRGTGASKKIQRVQDNWTLDDTLPEIPVTDSLPGGGLTHDFYGQLLEADQQTGFPGTSTIPVRQYNPVTGAEGLTVDVTGIPSNGGFTALSHNDWTGNYVGAFGNQISDFDVMTGAVFQVYSAKGVSDIQGMEAITWESTPAGGFLVANGADNKLYKVLLPEGGGGGVPPLPRAVANEGGFLYIVVDGSTKDKVLKVRIVDGVKVSEFDATSTNVESLVQFGGKLFYVDNASSPKRLHRVSTAGDMEAHSDLPGFVGDIGDLATDGTILYAAERSTSTIHKITPSITGGSAGTFTGSINATGGGPPFGSPFGFEGLVYAPPGLPALLIGSRYGTLWRMDPVTANVVGGDIISPGPPFDVTGMTLVGSSVIYMVDKATQAVYKAARPDAPPVDLTAAGSYQALLQVYVGGSLEITSPVSNFVLEKVSALTVNITSPSDGQGFGTPAITVGGSVSDPTATVLVGVALPEAVLFGNDTKTGASTLTGAADRAQYTESPSGSLWQFIDFAASGAIPVGVPPIEATLLTQIGSQRGQVAWYGKFDVPPSLGGGPIVPNYDTGFGPGGHNFGDLDTLAMLVGSSGVLTFDTWYDTEPGFYPDKKLIQFCSGAVCNTIAQITPDVPLAPVPGAPPGTYMPDFGALPGTVYQMPPFPGNPPWKMVYVPAARINPGTGQPQFTTVTLDLAALGVSGTGKIQFRFDTVDNFGNGYKGWIVDSVLVKGPTTVGSTAVVDRETFTWSASFTLAQGENAITATVTRSAYAPPLVATDSVSAFLDTVAPIVTIIAGATPTNVSARTIQIQYTSATPDSLEVTQTTSLGTRTVLIKRTGFSPPTETLSVPLSLDEGTNTFNATMTNQAALSANAAPKVVILDTAQPVLTTLATMYPVGEFSARAGDEAIFQANASDPGSGILKVEFIMPGGSVPAGMMLTAADIPAAVRDKWGTTAGYLLPFELPSSAASGTYTVTLKATDNAGNTKTATVNATVVATLQAFNLYLMPGRNLVSLPLQPTSGTDFDIATLLNQLAPNSNLGAGAKLSDVIDTISYFTGGTAATGAWLMYSTGPAADTLTTVTTGLAYWIKMKDGVFKLSDPLAPGLPQTAAPIKLTTVGQFLQPGDVPPTYDVVKDWNMRGLHAEYPRLVDSQFLRGVSSGVAVPPGIWVSLLEYQNFLKFVEGAAPEIKLGAFNSLMGTDLALPGTGFWLLMGGPGAIAP